MIRSVSQSEPEFSDFDRELLLAVALLDRDTGRHGELLSEALSPDTDPANREATGFYVAGKEVTGPDGRTIRVPYVNHAEAAAQRQMDAYYKANPAAAEQRSSHLWPVELIHRGT